MTSIPNLQAPGRDKEADIERATALAVAELVKHGGSERDVEHIVRQFKVLADDDKAESESRIIPE